MQEPQHNQIQSNYYDDEIDLRELFATIWAGKWIITAITTIFAIISIIVVLQISNEYQSTAVLSPAQSDSNGGLGAITGQFGGLASLAGINIGGNGGNDTQIALEIMKSWGFIEELITGNNLEVEVFAATGWNQNTNELIIDDDLYNAEQQKWIRDAPKGKTVEPTSWELFEAFSERLSVSEDKKSGLISVSIEYYSPILAKQWVDQIVKSINEKMRLRKLEEVTRNIEYLQRQIDQTSIAEMKEVFYQIVEEQTKNQMLAEASPEYSFVTVSGAMVAEEKSKPKRSLIVILATLLGGILSVVIVFIREFLKKDNAANKPAANKSIIK